MEYKLLQPLLQAGLLDIGDSDERLASIEKAIYDLTEMLQKETKLLPNYTLVALDPHIHPDDPVIIKVEQIISTHWKALRAKFTERPITIIRAVIIHALHNAGKESERNARIIYLTGTNFYPYAKLSREKDIIESLLREFGELSEENATEEWKLAEEAPTLKLGVLKIPPLKFEEVKVDGANLKAKLKQAAGRTPEGQDPYSHPEQWSTHFSNHASEGIGEILKTYSGALSDAASTSTIDTAINKFFTEFKKGLDQILKSSFTTTQSVEKRTKLLWWKETLYSPSLRKSYRDLPPAIQPFMMGYDLYQLLPAIAPEAVDYLLKDTLTLVDDKADEKITFSAFLNEFVKKENIAEVQPFSDEISVGDARISFTHFLELLAKGEVEGVTLKARTGIDESAEVTRSQIAVMVLHDWMANYLIPNPS